MNHVFHKICPNPNPWNLQDLNKGFANVFKIRISGLNHAGVRWTLNPMARVLKRGRRKRHRHTEERSPCVDRGGDGNHTDTSQGMPGATGSRKRQGEILPWSIQRECGPAKTLIQDLCSPELWDNCLLF